MASFGFHTTAEQVHTGDLVLRILIFPLTRWPNYENFIHIPKQVASGHDLMGKVALGTLVDGGTNVTMVVNLYFVRILSQKSFLWIDD